VENPGNWQHWGKFKMTALPSSHFAAQQDVSFPLFFFYFKNKIYVDNCASNEKIAQHMNVFCAVCRVVLKRQCDTDVIVKKINFNEINSRTRGANKIPLITLQWDV